MEFFPKINKRASPFIRDIRVCPIKQQDQNNEKKPLSLGKSVFNTLYDIQDDVQEMYFIFICT